MKTTKVYLLFLLTILTSCGGRPNLKPLVLANVFPLVDGAQWVLRNTSTGALTTISFSKYPGQWGCEQNSHQLFMSVWTKTDVNTYWNPTANDELHMLWEDNGFEIRSRGVHTFEFDSGTFATFDYVKVGSEDPYPIAPKSFTLGDDQIISAPYSLRLGGNEPSPVTTCLTDQQANGILQGTITWTTEWTTGDICTPFYCGPVVFSHQRENFPSATNEEVWALAPGIGIIQIEDRLRLGQPPAGLSPMILQRIK